LFSFGPAVARVRVWVARMEAVKGSRLILDTAAVGINVSNGALT
jgi:hypothetical protein